MEQIFQPNINIWNNQLCQQLEEGCHKKVFTFWFDRESIIPGNFGFAISVCRLRERGHMSKSVYVRVFHDLELCVCACVS